MVYRDIPVEEAQKRFDDATLAPETIPLEPIGTVQKPKRKVVKALVPKNK
jgi:hypothetical protein